MMKLTTLICPDSDCGAENERNADICRGCGSALGFVNVNLLSDPYFQEGLEERYRSVTANLPGAEVAWVERHRLVEVRYRLGGLLLLAGRRLRGRRG